MLQSTAELVGAGGAFGTTADAFYARNDIVDFLSLDESADSLQVAITAAYEEDLLYDIVLIGCDVDKLGAGTCGLILNVLHHRKGSEIRE